jgi:hypothetical protein
MKWFSCFLKQRSVSPKEQAIHLINEARIIMENEMRRFKDETEKEFLRYDFDELENSISTLYWKGKSVKESSFFGKEG